MRTPQNETDKVGTYDSNTNMSDYFRFSRNKALDRRASEVLTNKIHNVLTSDFFSGIGCFEGTIS